MNWIFLFLFGMVKNLIQVTLLTNTQNLIMFPTITQCTAIIQFVWGPLYAKIIQTRESACRKVSSDNVISSTLDNASLSGSQIIDLFLPWLCYGPISFYSSLQRVKQETQFFTKLVYGHLYLSMHYQHRVGKLIFQALWHKIVSPIIQPATVVQNSHRQHINKSTWLYSNKTL